MYGDDSDGQQFKYLNVFARIEGCEKWVEVRRTLSKNKDEPYNPDAPAAADACGGVIFSPSSWEPQEEGMMNIAARFFPQLRNQGMSIRRGRSQCD
jgi:hypothetical protein